MPGDAFSGASNSGCNGLIGCCFGPFAVLSVCTVSVCDSDGQEILVSPSPAKPMVYIPSWMTKSGDYTTSFFKVEILENKFVPYFFLQAGCIANRDDHTIGMYNYTEPTSG